MAEEYSRATRVAEQLQRELSDLIRRELRDPRLALLTVTGVDLSSDLGRAQVFVHSLDESVDGDSVAASLDKASGFLRSQLGKRLRLRIMPILEFRYDQALERAEHVSSLIAEARRHDSSGSAADAQSDDSQLDIEQGTDGSR